jgi:hypothetical protein
MNQRDLLFFDNLALYYVTRDTPPGVIARVFNSSDARLGGSILGVLEPKQRKLVHDMMSQENDGDERKNADAKSALAIVAEGLLQRGLIRKQGQHYYGVPSDKPLE